MTNNTETSTSLTADERAWLEFEREWWTAVGARAHYIKLNFGVSASTHNRRVSKLIDDPRAEAYDPMLVKRLRRMRARRRGHLGT